MSDEEADCWLSSSTSCCKEGDCRVHIPESVEAIEDTRGARSATAYNAGQLVGQ